MLVKNRAVGKIGGGRSPGTEGAFRHARDDGKIYSLASINPDVEKMPPPFWLMLMRMISIEINFLLRRKLYGIIGKK